MMFIIWSLLIIMVFLMVIPQFIKFLKEDSFGKGVARIVPKIVIGIGSVVVLWLAFAFILFVEEESRMEKARLERLEDERKSKRKTCVYSDCSSPVRKDGEWMCLYHIGDRWMIPQSARRIRWKEGHTEETVQISQYKPKCTKGRGLLNVLCPEHKGNCPYKAKERKEIALRHKISQLYVDYPRNEAHRRHMELVNTNKKSGAKVRWKYAPHKYAPRDLP